MRMSRWIVLLVIAQGLAGAACGEHGSVAPAATAPSPVTVTPPPNGFLSMRGTVSDTAFRSLAGARVEVLDGPQAGLSTTADSRGEFSLSGAFDDATRFRATKDGHVTATRTLQPFCAACNPNRWINFSLEVLAPPVNMAGDYIVTFMADSACTTLPNEVRTRTYAATIPLAPNSVPANAYVSVPLSGASFYKYFNDLSMGVAGDYVGFWLEVLVEQIAPNTFLSFGGLAYASIGTSDRSTIAFPFDGEILYCVTKPEGRFEDCFQGVVAVRTPCTSKNHQLILTRR